MQKRDFHMQSVMWFDCENHFWPKTKFKTKKNETLDREHPSTAGPTHRRIHPSPSLSQEERPLAQPSLHHHRRICALEGERGWRIHHVHCQSSPSLCYLSVHPLPSTVVATKPRVRITSTKILSTKLILWYQRNISLNSKAFLPTQEQIEKLY